MVAPFRDLFALVVFDGSLDLPQHLFAQLAHRCPQGSDGRRGVEVEDGHEVLMVQDFLRGEAAAGQQGVGHADGGGSAKLDADGIVIIRRQERSVNDVENVLPVVVPILGGQGRGDNLQLLHKAAVAGDLIGLFQRSGHCRQVRFFQRPQPGRAALPPGAGVGDVKDIPQHRAISAVIQEGDALRTALDIPPHAVVPEVIRRTGRSVRPLGVDHELIQIWILIKPGGGLQKS